MLKTEVIYYVNGFQVNIKADRIVDASGNPDSMCSTDVLMGKDEVTV